MHTRGDAVDPPEVDPGDEHGAPTVVAVTPAGPLRGRMPVPPSKSIAQRLLVWAAHAPDGGAVAEVGTSGDVAATLAALRDLAVPVRRVDARVVEVGPVPAAGFDASRVRVGESATLARLLLPLVATRSGSRATFEPAGTLRRRSPRSLRAALESLGARIAGEGFALSVEGVASSPPWTLREPTSSQDVSGLLGALAARGGGRLDVVGDVSSAPYVELTCAVLRELGVRVERVEGGWEVHGSPRRPAEPLVVEPDASAAGVALAAAATSDGEVRVHDVPLASVQGDVRIVEHLRAFGVAADHDERGLVAAGAPTRGAVLDLAGEPDLAPPLAAVAARAAADLGATSELRGLATLRGKESDRVAGLVEGLVALGFDAHAEGDSLLVGPGDLRAPARALDARGDHRLAFAFALLGTFVRDVRVGGAGCVAKSWPRFWRALADLGADVRRLER